MKRKLLRRQYYTYVLLNDLGYRVGVSNNILNRFNQHQAGKCKTSSSVDDPENLDLVWVWTSPHYRLSSKLKRFIHQGQHEHGNDYVIQVINDMPVYTTESQNIIDLSGHWSHR